MNGNKPTRKVGAAGIAGAVSVLIVWGLGAAGVSVPAEVSSAMTTVISFVTGYVVTDSEV